MTLSKDGTMKQQHNLTVVTLGIWVAASTLVTAILLWPYAKPAGETSVSMPGRTYTDITAPQLAEMLRKKDFVFNNTHVPYVGEIETTDAFIPFDQIAQSLNRLPVDKAARIVLYCLSGNMSTTAAKTLVGLGYTHVMSLAGGMSAWRTAGFSISEDKNRK